MWARALLARPGIRRAVGTSLPSRSGAWQVRGPDTWPHGWPRSGAQDAPAGEHAPSAGRSAHTVPSCAVSCRRRPRDGGRGRILHIGKRRSRGAARPSRRCSRPGLARHRTRVAPAPWLPLPTAVIFAWVGGPDDPHTRPRAGAARCHVFARRRPTCGWAGSRPGGKRCGRRSACRSCGIWLEQRFMIKAEHERPEIRAPPPSLTWPGPSSEK